MSTFDRRLCSASHSVMFCGPDRTAVAVAAYALAAHGGRTVTWLDVRSPYRPPDPYVSLLAPFVPLEQRIVTSSPDDLAPEIAVSNVAVWSLIRESEPNEAVVSLIDFLRLPQSVQTLVSEGSTPEDGSTLLVTNSDRLSPLYPEDVASTRAFVQAITRQSVKLVASLAGLDRKDRFAYDVVFQVSPGAADGWANSILKVEKGELAAGSAGRLPTPLRSVDEVGPFLAGPTESRTVDESGGG
ncbi:MAG: hypothetical protein L3K05_01885 [Thermoplasmata archaeon]|nr:hypothetical protein [Thermoplasmata archaeon]